MQWYASDLIEGTTYKNKRHPTYYGFKHEQKENKGA
jgi:hypothetical protein